MTRRLLGDSRPGFVGCCKVSKFSMGFVITCSYNDSVVFGNIPVHPGTFSRNSFKCLIVGFEESEPGFSSQVPLEVIHKAPMEVSSHIGTVFYGLMEPHEMIQNIAWPFGIIFVCNAIFRN